MTKIIVGAFYRYKNLGDNDFADGELLKLIGDDGDGIPRVQSLFSGREMWVKEEELILFDDYPSSYGIEVDDEPLLPIHAELAAYDAVSEEVDMVNHPPHYANKNPETIDMIRSILTKEEFIGGLKWQILKYRDRAHEKGQLEQDMAKAKFYYDLLLEVQG